MQNTQLVISDPFWNLTSELRYVYDGMLVTQERDGNNLPQVSYTRGKDLSETFEDAGGIGGLLARTDYLTSSAPLKTTFYHTDGKGNVTVLLNTNGLIVAWYEYDPYGNISIQNGLLAEVNSYRFSSKEYYSRSGLYYYGYRLYSPELQRWQNRDPLQESGGLNLYEFVDNNPVGLVDAFGELPASNQTCQSMKRRIENIEKDIRKRIGQMDENPQNLPETDPDDKAHPSKSRRGHRKIINELKKRLAELKGLYDASCSDPEPAKPVSLLCPMFAGGLVSPEATGPILGVGAGAAGALGGLGAGGALPLPIPIIP